MCLPKDYVFGQDKCKPDNNDELNYEQKKSSCNPDDGCRWIDGYCKVWEPVVTTAATTPTTTVTEAATSSNNTSGTGSGNSSDASRNNPGIITEPAVKRKPPSDKLKKFSDDTGCLLYNEEASEKIQCVPSKIKRTDLPEEPITTSAVDSIPVYSADGKLNENISPFHQLREAELILNKL